MSAIGSVIVIYIFSFSKGTYFEKEKI